MAHEQSETIQREDGKWINVYGRKLPKAGQMLPGERPYDSREEAEEAARRRSKEFKPKVKPDGKGGLLDGLPGASRVTVRRAPRLGAGLGTEVR